MFDRDPKFLRGSKTSKVHQVDMFRKRKIKGNTIELFLINLMQAKKSIPTEQYNFQILLFFCVRIFAMQEFSGFEIFKTSIFLMFGTKNLQISKTENKYLLGKSDFFPE